jgi:hypothetical protein
MAVNTSVAIANKGFEEALFLLITLPPASRFLKNAILSHISLQSNRRFIDARMMMNAFLALSTSAL